VRVLMVTPEATPFAQTGGLGEVLSALPPELAKLGVEVDVLMPKYRGITPEAFGIKKADLRIELTLNAKRVDADFWQLRDKSGVRYLFLECDQYYDREYLYGTPEADYEDNAERFVFLSRAAIEMAILSRPGYDVFHSHDWQTALTPVYLRTLYAGISSLEQRAAVLTIHNLGYQGIFWHLDMPLVGVGWEFFTPKHMEFHGKLNFLKSGLVFVDEVNTVSSGYRNEILTPEFGFGLEGVLQERQDHLFGILNGVDYSVWNPGIDKLIAANYSPEDTAGKSVCKADLQNVAGLPARPDVPLITMVSRLSGQKGIDILQGSIEWLMGRGVQLVLLGTGEARYQNAFRDIGERYPQQIGLFLKYDYALAHKIFAGGDMIIMPSRYEPCGINQLYGLKYGSVPIARATGGLTDTVDEFDPERGSGTGFKFTEPDSLALREAVARALEIFHKNPDAWKALMIRGMNMDFSWKRSATEYIRLYEKAIEDRKKFIEQTRMVV
jgi:starch synthase